MVRQDTVYIFFFGGGGKNLDKVAFQKSVSVAHGVKVTK